MHRLRANSAAIHVAWETLLRIEPVTTALALPETLRRLIPDSVAQILMRLSPTPRPQLSLTAAKSDRLPSCDCGNNPYLAYFVAGERAVMEVTVLQQADLPAAKRHEHDLAEVIHVVRGIARNEIETFCGVCTHRCKAERCRHRLPSAVATACRFSG